MEAKLYKFWNDNESDFTVGYMNQIFDGEEFPYEADSWDKICYKHCRRAIVTKHIPYQSADKLFLIMNKIRNEYPNVEFLVVADDEGTTEYKGNSPEEVIEAMDGIDSDFGLNCYDFDLEHYLGWFFLTPYEEDEPVCVYDDNDFCNWALDN